MMQMPAADPWGSGLAAASTTKPPRRCRRNGLVKHRFDCGHDADAGARIVKLPFDCVRVTGVSADSRSGTHLPRRQCRLQRRRRPLRDLVKAQEGIASRATQKQQCRRVEATCSHSPWTACRRA
ncbi:hypothetical protein PC116_g28179 [Phytophthora cactorum]|nr:hypothetical protein Pcac1_g11603 [Phytophthora cactorum]KAG4223353.1 hypothetical protein PC116_g28179 [Phytophthora cactorum]